MKRVHRPWTTKELAIARRMRAEKRSVSAVAEVLGRNTGTVQTMLEYHGVEGPKKSDHIVGVLTSRGRSWGWSEKDLKTAIRMCKRGKSCEAIGKRLNKSAGAVRAMMNKKGIKPCSGK